MKKIIKGKVWKYGNDINTDLIIPGKYLQISDQEALAKYALNGIDKDFSKKVKEGDIIVAGNNFGCGSSREQAVICLKYLGIGGIIAKSYARIFFRNAINLGLPIFISKDVDKIQNNDLIEINIEKGIIKNISSGEKLKYDSLPKFLLEIINDGGLIQNLKKKLEKNKN